MLHPVARRRLVVAVAAVAAAAGVFVLVPQAASPVERLVNVEADGAEPLWNVPIDFPAVRRAAELMPEGGADYYVHAPPQAKTTPLYHDILGATYLTFPPSRPVARPRDAEWVFSYRAGSLLPPGLEARATHRAGNGIYLVRVR